MHTRNLALVLRFLALVVFVGALHLALGVRADILLGADVPNRTIATPILDSQGRSYVVSFVVYGVPPPPVVVLLVVELVVPPALVRWMPQVDREVTKVSVGGFWGDGR